MQWFPGRTDTIIITAICRARCGLYSAFLTRSSYRPAGVNRPSGFFIFGRLWWNLILQNWTV
jgi:hypothetical protein